MHNKFKGTLDVVIDGETYTMRPTFDAMECFTQEAKMSEREAFDKIASNTFSSALIVNAIYAGIMGEYWATNRASKHIERRVLGELMMREGVAKFSVNAYNFLLFAMVPAETAIKTLQKVGEEKKSQPEPSNTNGSDSSPS